MVLAVVIGVVPSLLSFLAPVEAFPFDAVIMVCATIVSLLYYIGYWSRSGQTIGKMLTGLKVVWPDGVPVTIGKATLRYVGYIISAALLSLGFVWIVFD